MPKIFLSYDHYDQQFVEKLASRLRDDGVTIWLDRLDMLPGDLLVEGMVKGIRASDFLLVVLSSESVASAWVQREVSVALSQEINEGSIVVIPLLHSLCDIPDSLCDKKYADFSMDFDAGYEELISRLRSDEKPLNGLPEELKKIRNRVLSFLQQKGAASDDTQGTPLDSTHYLSYWALAQLSELQIQSVYSGLEQYVSKRPRDATEVFWCGICSLELGDLDVAVTYFERCLQLSSSNPEYHYNMALALLKGRRPFRLKIKEIRTILTHSTKAIALNGHVSKYLFLQFLINEDYFNKIGADVPGAASTDLLAQAALGECQDYELARLIRATHIQDNTLLQKICCSG